MTKFEKIGNALTWMWIIFSLLAWAFLLFVGIDERASRNETEWRDGGGRHVEEMVSEKLSNKD